MRQVDHEHVWSVVLYGMCTGANARSEYFEGSASTALERRLGNIAGMTGIGSLEIGYEPFSYNRAALRVNRSPSAVPFRLPPLQIAKRWYSTHYSYIGTIFAFSTREWFDLQLAKAYNGLPDTSDPDSCLAYAKVLTILAFGQLYSVNQWDSFDGPPGFELFCHALQYLPSIHEESSLLFVETLALVGYYMQNLGERDAAFLYVGTALRMAISLALHQEVRSMQLDDVQKERRRRVWWSVYSMDRILTIKSGNPIMVQDEDIGVEPPSRLVNEPQYGPWIVLRCYTELSKILTQIMHEVYRTPQKTGSNLMASVQSILASLSAWNRDLPPELHFNIDKLDFTRESVSTFLHYYQCINMTVRPLLFLIVERRMRWTAEERVKDWRYDLSPPTISAIETCISAARDTIAMVTIAAQKNLFATYGYMDGEHCFSAAIVLVLVCLAFPFNEEGFTAMDSALRMLQLMVDRGNANMAPRLQLLQQVRSCISTPVGIKLPVEFTPSSNDVLQNAHLDPMIFSSFPHLNNAALGELWLDSSPGDFSLWEEGYTSQDPHMEYDLLQWTQPTDTAWAPGNV
jgi:proline utilization trans-activator